MASTGLLAVLQPILYTSAVTFAFVVSALAVTYLLTTVRYYLTLDTEHTDKKTVAGPVKVPYILPWLGHTFSFLSTEPGAFWNSLFSWLPRASGACTLLLGGRPLHILYDPHAAEFLFKAREPNRDKVTLEVLTKGFGMSEAEVEKFVGHGETSSKHEQERINNEYLMKTSRVNELTFSFVRTFKEELATQLQGEETSIEVDLYKWLRTMMFRASTTAFFGSSMVEDCPNLEEDFFAFDSGFLTCFFGVPRWLAPEPYRVRDRITESFVRHAELTEERTKGEILDPDGDVAWDPLRGARVHRARHHLYRSRNISLLSGAILDLGMFFGISSNAMPGAGWVLGHIFDPSGDSTLQPRLLKEIQASQRSDGSFDLPTLFNQPLLLSTLHEVFRLYIDNLVTRQMSSDFEVPVGPSGKRVVLGKDSLVLVPSWLNHRDGTNWKDPERFIAERWLVDDEDVGKDAFSTRGSAGKFYPFGGGKSVCPGRTFAKQEIIAAVALVLSEFEIQGLGFVDDRGRKTNKFPSPSKAYPGPAMMVMGGDVRVRITRRS